MEAIDYSAVPRQRLAQALRAAREMVGLDELAAADALGVSLRRLRLLEGGRRSPRDHEIEALCELYGLDLGGGLARRVPIVFDAERGGIVIAGRLVRYVPGVTDNDDFLEAYVRVVRELRGLDEDTPIQLRANDLAVLAVVLDLDDEELEDRVAFWLGQPPGSQVGLRHRLVLAAVVIGVAGSATVGGIIANSHAASAQSDAGPAAVQQFDGPPGGHGHVGDGGHVGHNGPPGHDDAGGHAAHGHDAGTHVGDAAVDGGHHVTVDAGGDVHGAGHVGGLDGSTLTIDSGDGSTLSLDFSSMTGISGGFDLDLDAVHGVAPHADAGHAPAAPVTDAGHAPAAPVT
ncbi:MAG: XRE family transcriptional regulator, partial [Actinomyces sp.]